MHTFVIQIHRNGNIDTTVHRNTKIDYMVVELDLKKFNITLVDRYSDFKNARNERVCCTVGLQITSFCLTSFHYIVDFKKLLAGATALSFCSSCALPVSL